MSEIAGAMASELARRKRAQGCKPGAAAAGAGGTAAGAKRAKIDFRSAILALLQGRAPGKTC